MPARGRKDAGESLIEVLISLVIIGTVIAALLAGLATVSTASANHRLDTTADGVLRAYAEALKTTTYVAGPTSYVLTGAEFTPLSGYVPSVTAKKCLTAADTSGNADAASSADFTTCTIANDAGVQLLSLQVTYGTNGLQSFTILKRKP